MSINAHCHCGAVTYRYNQTPRWATSCNCSICRRLGALWIYAPVSQVILSGPTIKYSYGERSLAFHSCSACGCTTHWENLKPDAKGAYMAVNLRLADPDIVDRIPVRRFDGAASWTFLDPEPD